MPENSVPDIFTKKKIEDDIIAIIKEFCETVDKSKDTKNISLSDKIKDYPFDSLDVVELIMNLEDTFSVFITDDEADSLETIEDIVKLVTEKVKNDSRLNE